MLRKGLVITTVILLPIATVLFIMSVHELFKMKTVTVDPKLKEISGIEFDKYKVSDLKSALYAVFGTFQGNNASNFSTVVASAILSSTYLM